MSSKIPKQPHLGCGGPRGLTPSALRGKARRTQFSSLGAQAPRHQQLLPTTRGLGHLPLPPARLCHLTTYSKSFSVKGTSSISTAEWTLKKIPSMICKKAANGFPEPQPPTWSLSKPLPLLMLPQRPGLGATGTRWDWGGRYGAQTPSPGLGGSRERRLGQCKGRTVSKPDCPLLHRRRYHGTGRKGLWKSRTISSQSGVGHPGETRPRLPISGSSAPHSRCPPLSAGISQGPSSSPSYLEGSPHPRPARVPHFSISAVFFSSGASTTPSGLPAAF